MDAYYFFIPSYYSEELGGQIAGPYIIDEIMKVITGYDSYLDNLTYFTVPLKYEGKEYNDELSIFFNSDTIVLNENKNPIKIAHIPKLQDLLERNAQILEVNRNEEFAPFIKLFPSSNEVFSMPNDLHNKFCFPILSVHLSKINPQWNEWVHLVVPSAFWSYNYDETLARKFEGWESHYDFICLLDDNCKYIIEQGNKYLVRDETDNDLAFLKKDYEHIMQSNTSFTLRLGANNDDWYRKYHEPTYFTKDNSEIVHIVTIEFGPIIHLFYQPEYRRIIHFAQSS